MPPPALFFLHSGSVFFEILMLMFIKEYDLLADY